MGLQHHSVWRMDGVWEEWKQGDQLGGHDSSQEWGVGQGGSCTNGEKGTLLYLFWRQSQLDLVMDLCKE